MKMKAWVSSIENGEETDTVEMGGINDGYELSIQNLAVRICKSLPEMCPDTKEEADKILRSVRDNSVKELNEKHGFSGAQVGAATNIAANIWKRGTESFQDVKDRIIRVKTVNNELTIIR